MDPIALENTLEKKCKNHLWLVKIFLLASTPTIFSAAHITSYVFLGDDPQFFCTVPELQEANWTNEQIQKIITPGTGEQSCMVYGWNYTLLKEMGFDEAVTYCNTTNKPMLTNCKSYIYDEETPHQTIVSQWDLVCDNIPLRRPAQVAIALGKFLAAFIFGVLADRFGRKKIFISSCLLFMVAGPAGAFVDTYAIFIILRVLVGFASSGLYEVGYIILSEITVKNYRAIVGSLYNIPFSFGFIFLPLAAYFTNNWRQLQLAISLPTIFLLFHCWYLPESPRWLITRKKIENETLIESESHKYPEALNHHVNKEKPHSCNKKIIIFLKNCCKLFSTLELTKRILICYFEWFTTTLYYFSIIMNGTNFTVNKYMYVALNGIVEAPSYVLSLFLLKHFGRKSTAIVLLTISGLTLLAILVIPQGWPVMCMAMMGRVTSSAVFAVVVLQTSELIPTEYRSTVLGSSLGVAQLGTMSAPYIVDSLGKKAWWIPSTLCGTLSILGALLMVFLPETKGVVMLDTVGDMELGRRNTKATQSANS